MSQSRENITANRSQQSQDGLPKYVEARTQERNQADLLGRFSISTEGLESLGNIGPCELKGMSDLSIDGAPTGLFEVRRSSLDMEYRIGENGKQEYGSLTVKPMQKVAIGSFEIPGWFLAVTPEKSGLGIGRGLYTRSNFDESTPDSQLDASEPMGNTEHSLSHTDAI